MKLKALLLPLALLCVSVPAFGQTASSRIAVVNPGKVLQEMKEFAEFRQGIEGENVRLKAMEDEKKLELQKLQSQRDQLKNDTPQWEELNNKLTDAYGDFQLWGQKTKVKNERNQKRGFVQLYLRIEQAVSEVAKRDGFDLVITDQRPDMNSLVEQANVDQSRGALLSRSVLFASEKADISEAVIQQVNATYKAKGGGAAGTPTPTSPAAAPTPAKKPAAGPAPK